jgi:hypothetical protein
MQKRRQINRMKVFWVTTPDGYENWFVVARTKKDAEISHEIDEGYNPNYAHATFVCDVPLNLHKVYRPDKKIKTYWPRLAMLEELGFKVISRTSPRVVNKDGRIFTEGRSIEAIAIELGSESPGVYVLQAQGKNEYKIGYTSNLKQRIRTVSNGNASTMKLAFYVETRHFKSLEKHLKDVYKNNRLQREWFSFSEDDKEDIKTRLRLMEYLTKQQFHFVDVEYMRKHGRC